MTLDPDVEAMVRQVMAERDLSFKDALNGAVRAGLAGDRGGRGYRLQARHLGQAAVPLAKALQLASELEDEETARKLALGK